MIFFFVNLAFGEALIENAFGIVRPFEGNTVTTFVQHLHHKLDAETNDDKEDQPPEKHPATHARLPAIHHRLVSLLSRKMLRYLEIYALT